MNTWKTIALLVAALLVLTVAGCGAHDETITTGASTTGAPQTTTTTGQTVSTTAATEQMTTSTTAVASDERLAEEYEAYSALIQSVYIDATRPALIVIEDTTAKADASALSPRLAVGAMGSLWPELGDEILSDFKTKNQTPSVLVRRFTLSVKYAFISEQELASISSVNSGWEDFYAKYPGSQGILTLSRAGFNEAKDTAVLYTENQYHSAGGEGDVVLMKKTAGRWTVQGEAMIWES
jgi:hypothetical protein